MKYQLGLYEKAMPAALSWPDRLAAAGAAGFDYVEISIDETDARLSRLLWTADDHAALMNAMLETGVPIRSMCLSAHRKYPLGSSDAATRARALEIMDGALRMASALGLRVIQLAGYDVYYEPSTEETRGCFGENLRACVEMAAAAGVALGFETMETPFMDTTAKAMRYVDDIGSPYLGVYPDIGNLANASALYGVSVPDDLGTGTGHLLAMHLKETKPGVYRELAFGTGCVDFAEAVAAGKALGVRRYVAELWDDGSPAWADTIRHAGQFLRRFLVH